jgi:hypothetical protein
MATLKRNGTELARFEYESGTLVVMSNGRVLRNRGDGWERYRHAKPGVAAETIAAERRARFEARRAACPTWAEYIEALCDAVALRHRSVLATAIAMMPTDADGVWSTMDDYGMGLDLDDVVRLCDLRTRGEAELRAFKQAKE